MVDIIIDKLTNSILDSKVQSAFETKVIEATESDMSNITDWLFDWKKIIDFQ